MARNSACTVYVGNLDERVNDRVLYEILIQAGRVVDLYIPRDRETSRPKGFAFAEYETEDIANYAVRLFSGLVTLFNRKLKFAISGQDKPSENMSTLTPLLISPPKPRVQPGQQNNAENFPRPAPLSTSCRVSAYTQSLSPNYPQEPTPGVVTNGHSGSEFSANNFDYGRRVFGAATNSIGRFEVHTSRATYESSTYESRNPISYPSY